jgi:uncharacterized protein
LRASPCSAKRRYRSVLVLAATAALLLAACSDSGGGESDEAVALADAAPLDAEVNAGVEQVVVTGAEPGTELRLVDRDGREVEAYFAPDGHRAGTGIVDDAGNLLFGRVPSDEGYQVVAGTGDQLQASEPLDVLAVGDPPDDLLYESQELHEGINYLQMRDGTTLAAMVRFPSLPREDTPEGGPYPTVIEMSGYDPANPEAPEPATQLADVLGFATVGINLRGTGCSGGSLSFFESAQVADGYDAIQTVAAQDWVAHHQVGMVGVSYPGITQLFVASTAPPGLAAITPQSVIDEVYPGILYPGGIYNSGFAREWSEAVYSNSNTPEEYVATQIEDGDDECEANQALRSQNLDLVAGGQATPFYSAERYGPISPATLVDGIEVPVFLTGQWQDEQTGGHFSNMLDDFTGTDQLRVTMTNGSHGDALIPPTAQRWAEFLDFYVARRIPELPAAVRALVPPTLNGVFGEGEGFGPDRFADDDSYEEALAAYEAEEPIRVLFENGAATPNPGGPGATFEADFESWPPPDAEPTTWWFQPEGGLATEPPTVADGEDGSSIEYVQDPDQGQERTLDEAGVEAAFGAQPPFDWPSPVQGEAGSWITEPLDEDVVVAGPARADLWIQSSAPDTDLEVTVTEVAPDGSETYVQSGWLRASHRALDEAASTELRPVALHTEEAAAPLPEGEWTEVSVEVFPFAYAFREGSRIRIYVDTPGGNRARWAFDTVDAAGEANLVAESSDYPSGITLAVVPGIDPPRERPACGALRAEPCRPYDPIDNVPAG